MKEKCWQSFFISPYGNMILRSRKIFFVLNNLLLICCYIDEQCDYFGIEFWGRKHYIFPILCHSILLLLNKNLS